MNPNLMPFMDEPDEARLLVTTCDACLRGLMVCTTGSEPHLLRLVPHEVIAMLNVHAGDYRPNGFIQLQSGELEGSMLFCSACGGDATVLVTVPLIKAGV